MKAVSVQANTAEVEAAEDVFVLPTSLAQQRLWLLDQLNPQAAAYNMPTALRLIGDLDIEALEQSLSEIVRRHEILRTTFRAVDDEPMQVIAPARAVRLPITDLRELEPGARAQEERRLINEEAWTPFDLSCGPLLRTRLFRTGTAEHVLVIVQHHITNDGWSKEVFMRELIIAYEAFGEGCEPELPELPIQYADFAQWQRELLQGETLEQELEYWRSQLADLPGSELPTDRRRPPIQTFAGATESFTIAPELSNALKNLSKRERATLFATLLTAFKVLTARYCGQEDIVVGTPSTNRTRAEFEPLIGFFVNTLVIRTKLDADPTFREALRRVRQTVLGALEHQDLPFDRLVHELAPTRNVNQTPFFQVMFALAEAHSKTRRMADLQMVPIEIKDRFAKFDLLLEVTDERDTLRGSLNYNVDLFDAATIRRMAGHFCTLLAGIVANPEARLSELPLLDDAERQQILVDWNDTGREYPATNICLHELIEKQVERTPDAVALIFEEESLTYRELNRRANRLAHRLRQLGVGPEAIVGVFAERSLEMATGLIATLKAGGAYLPLDPTYPADRLAFMLGDAKPAVVLMQRRLAAQLPAHETKVVFLEDDLAGESDTNTPNCTQPENLAYVIYTSGSTGQPKGVMITHRGVCNRLRWVQESFPLDSSDCMMLKAPFTFDVSVSELFWPLIAGARLVVARPGVQGDSRYLIDTICKQGITVLEFVPGLLSALLEDKDFLRCLSLRLAFCGGEWLPVDLPERFFAALPHAELHNAFGPTETTIDVTFWKCEPGARDSNPPIGRPIANTQAYILDRAMQPVPVGVAGELHIAGLQLARGYLGRPDLTAEKFVPNPFAAGRLYKTGDLCRFRSDGAIEFLGRIDHQVKLRGFRIELGEVEAVLKRHPAVRECVAVVREDGTEANKRLVSYVVANGVSPEEFRRHAQETLAGYMVPSAFVFLDKIPRTSSGKVDRKALPAPDFAAAASAWRGPRTPREEILCSLFREILGLSRVGIDDNFFNLGGDSIGSIQLVSRARKAGLLITPRDVFEHQTVEALAAVASRIKDSETPALTGPESGAGALPPTPIIHQLLEQGGPIGRFSQSMLLQVPANLVQEHLVGALQALLDHHDALRLRLVRAAGSGAGNWSLEIPPPGAIRAAECLRRLDVSGLEEPARQVCIRAQTEPAEGRLAPEAGIMVQAVWFDAGPTRPGRLLWVIHHLAVDGVSWRILLPDLAAAYRAIETGQPPRLTPCGTSFRHWAQRLNAQAKDPARLSELSFWQATLSAPDLPLSLQALDPERDTLGTAGRISLTLPVSVTSQLLTAVPAAFHGRINDVLLCALALAVADWRRRQQHSHNGHGASQNGHSASNTVLIDLEGHGRQEESFAGVDLSRTVGWFTSLFPVRLDPGTLNLTEALAGGPALAQALKRIKEQLRTLPDNGLGYGLLRHLNPEAAASLSGLATPQICFNYLGRFSVPQAADWAIAPEAAELGAGGDPAMPFNYCLRINAVTHDLAAGPQLTARWSWPGALLSKEAVSDLAQSWFSALQALVDHVAQPGAGGHTPSDFPLVALTQVEIERLEAEHPKLEDIWPLAPLQQGLLFHALYDTQGLDVYTVQVVLGLEGSLQEPVLQAAANALLQRHANLRASFQHSFNQPLQLIHSEVSLPWRTVDLSTLEPAAAREEHFAQLLAQDRAQHFDLSAAPLLRFTLARFGPDQHRLILTKHHILMDGWSGPILVRELFTLYAQNGKSSALPRVTPYRDYLAWLAAQDQAAARAAWQAQLAGLEEPTRLAAPHSGRAPAAPERIILDLPKPLTEALTRQARSNSLTLNTILQGAWAILLGRLTGRDDVVFGVTVSGRPPEIPGIESMVGLFINTLPLRARLRWSDSLIELFTHLQQNQAQLLAHQHLGLHEIQRLAGLRELFDTLLVFENYPIEGSAKGKSFAGLRLTSAKGTDASHYPLSLVVAPGERLRLRLDYRPDCFEPSSAEAIAQRLARLLEAVVADPDQAIGTVDLLAPQERQQILVDWTRTETQFPRDASISELLEQQVARTPEAIAIEHGTTRWTYRELNERANRLAHALRDAGAGAEALIGICLERSAEMIAAMLAILKAGGAYVPIDPAYPAERRSLMLEGVPLLVTTGQLAQEFADCTARVVCVDDQRVLAASRQNLPYVTNGGSLAYVIYTSGSTGQPKGVAIVHRAVNRLVINTNYIALDQSDVVAQTSNCCFDAATFEIWGALLNGARLVVLSKDLTLSPASFLKEIKQRGITTLWLTTSLFNLMAQHEPRAFAGLRNVLFGGEAADARSVAAVLKQGAPGRLINGYGPTETTTFAICHEVRSVPEEAASIPIGRPISNTTIYILDAHQNPVPIGVAGEIYIGGPGVARGYVGAPELTAERFLPDRFSSEPDARLYRTGDLARWLPDGTIEYLGRIDQQVKIRGFRIEPGEIEAALKQHPAVRDAVVVVGEHASGDKRLVAYVAGEVSALNDTALRDFLKAKLPDYMVPSAIVALEKFPLNANGKLDRHALPEPDQSAASEHYVAPRNQLEEQLVKLWQEVLGVQPLGVTNDFFALGGHSLLAVRIFAAIESIFGKKLPLATLFQSPTIEKLAAALREQGWQPSWSPLVAIQPRGLRPPFFAVHAGLGEVMFYSELARCLGEDQPFYGLQAEGLDGGPIRHTSIEAIARYYLQEIRRVQAHGPYFLGGYCTGGLVALEMAQQLRSAGEDVALLALFDTIHSEQPTLHSSISKRIQLALEEARALPPSDKMRYFAQRAAHRLKWEVSKLQKTGYDLKELLYKMRKPDREKANGGPLPLKIPVWLMLRRAQSAYKPRPYPGRIVLFRPITSDGREPAEDRGWTEIAEGGLEIHDVPGKHGTLFEPRYVSSLAEKLDACIRTARNSQLTFCKTDESKKCAETITLRHEAKLISEKILLPAYTSSASKGSSECGSSE